MVVVKRNIELDELNMILKFAEEKKVEKGNEMKDEKIQKRNKKLHKMHILSLPL